MGSGSRGAAVRRPQFDEREYCRRVVQRDRGRSLLMLRYSERSSGTGKHSASSSTRVARG